MLRGKIYSCTDKKTYSVSFIDYRNKKMIAISNGQKKEFDFKEVEWLGTYVTKKEDLVSL